MRISTMLVLLLCTCALGGTASTEAAARFGLAGKVFLIEATIESSPMFPEYEGAVLSSCFTFAEDGSWIDLEWPGEGLDPIPGAWVQHTEAPIIHFSAYAPWPEQGWTLVEYGIAMPGQRPNSRMTMATYAMVFSATNELVFYLTTKGRSVAHCPL